MMEYDEYITSDHIKECVRVCMEILNYKYELKKKESLGAIVPVALFLWFSRNSHSV